LMAEPRVVSTGDRVILRKPHPCGGSAWTVTRTGADIGLACDTCGRRVMLDREDFERRVRSIDSAPDASGDRGRC